MKKIIITAAVVVAACFAQASLVNWGGNFASGLGSTSYTYDDGTTSLTLQSGWSILLFETTSSTIDFADYATYADAIASAVASTSVLINDVAININDKTYFTASNTSVTDNSYIYTVLFNSSDASTATYYLVLDSVAVNAGAYDPAAAYVPTLTVGDGSTAQISMGSQTWVAVPEPATIGLFGLGALSAWFIRRSKKASEEA